MPRRDGMQKENQVRGEAGGQSPRDGDCVGQ